MSTTWPRACTCTMTPSLRSRSTCASEDAPAVFDAHGRPDRPEVVAPATRASSPSAGTTGRVGNDACGGRSAQSRIRSRKLALSCTSRMRASITDHPERVRHTAWHRHPVSGTDDELVVTAAHDHLAIEDVPGVVEVSCTCNGAEEPTGKVISSTTVSMPGAQRCSTTKGRGTTTPAPVRSGGMNIRCVHWDHLLATTRPESASQDLTIKSYGILTIMSRDSFAGEHPGGELPRYVGAMMRVVWQWVCDK